MSTSSAPHTISQLRVHPQLAGGYGPTHSIECTCGWSFVGFSEAEVREASAEHDPLPAIRSAYNGWLQTSTRSDAAFRRVVEGKVRTTSAATRLAREVEEREADFEQLCYQAQLDPRVIEAQLRREDEALRDSILRSLGMVRDA